MIIDVTGIVLTPGNCGDHCMGNGKHFDADGQPIECCCDECSYMLCCLQTHDSKECLSCKDRECPLSPSCGV